MDNINPSLTLPPGTKIPDHLALVLDGNRRWARARGLPPWEGHKAGYRAAITVAATARKWGIHTVTFWGFSTENWDRSTDEITKIMDLVRVALADVRKEARKEKVRVVHLGRKDRLPKDIVATLEKIEDETRNNQNHVLNWALDHGGRDEIIRATQNIVKAGVKAEDIDEKLFSSYLDTADQPYPYVDLFIRPSGEQRTSGLMVWQMAHAEYYWEPDHLPDFSPKKLLAAVLDYSRRRRRFGANDVEEHLKFNPRLVAELELQFKHQLAIGPGEKFKDLVIRYIKEHYGLSKDLAKEAGINLAKALLYGREENWEGAKDALLGMYVIIQKTLKLAFEPEIIARFEISIWRDKTEDKFRQYLAEKFRVSDFQATKSAHLAWLANVEIEKQNWEKGKLYMERFYRALKERVA